MWDKIGIKKKSRLGSNCMITEECESHHTTLCWQRWWQFLKPLFSVRLATKTFCWTFKATQGEYTMQNTQKGTPFASPHDKDHTKITVAFFHVWLQLCALCHIHPSTLALSVAHKWVLQLVVDIRTLFLIFDIKPTGGEVSSSAGNGSLACSLCLLGCQETGPVTSAIVMDHQSHDAGLVC